MKQQQAYIKFLENEIISLKNHFSSVLERIEAHNLFGTNWENGSIDSSPSAKKRVRETPYVEESEGESESESSSDEAKSRKTRQTTQKKKKTSGLESDEESYVTNVFEMVWFCVIVN